MFALLFSPFQIHKWSHVWIASIVFNASRSFFCITNLLHTHISLVFSFLSVSYSCSFLLVTYPSTKLSYQSELCCAQEVYAMLLSVCLYGSRSFNWIENTWVYGKCVSCLGMCAFMRYYFSSEDDLKYHNARKNVLPMTKMCCPWYYECMHEKENGKDGEKKLLLIIYMLLLSLSLDHANENENAFFFVLLSIIIFVCIFHLLFSLEYAKLFITRNT